MTITTNKVRKVKIFGVYQANDKILRIHNRNPNEQHNIIVTSIKRKNKTARVKTITSLERLSTDRYGNQRYTFMNHKLDDVRDGNILVIAQKLINTHHLSGINHRGITIKLNQIHYKEPNDNTRFPKRYKKLIIRK